MRIAIRQEIARSDESRYDHRLHGMLLAASGKSCTAVADLFGEDARTVQRRVHRFESGSFEGLREGERPAASPWPALVPSACPAASSSDQQRPSSTRSASKSFLKTLLRHRRVGRRMVIVLDNAAYYHAASPQPLLRQYRAILRLIFLPPYCLHLASVEWVWKLTRRLATHNRYFVTLDELVHAATTCFDRWRKPNAVLQRLCGII